VTDTASATLAAGTTVQVDAVVQPKPPPSLADQIISVAGQDPILLGATGYMDNIFTSRLAGKTE
jgi:hypothetical protein